MAHVILLVLRGFIALGAVGLGFETMRWLLRSLAPDVDPGGNGDRERDEWTDLPNGKHLDP